MDNLDLGSLNYWAILAAVVFNQVLGAAWYSGLAKPWMAEVGLTSDDMEAMKGTSTTRSRGAASSCSSSTAATR